MKYLLTNSTLDRTVPMDNLNYSHCEGLDIYEGKNHKFIGTVINGKLIKPETKMNKFKTKRGLCTAYALAKREVKRVYKL